MNSSFYRTNLALSVCPSGSTHRSRYSYKSPSFLRRSTELPDKFSSMIIPKLNFKEAMRDIHIPLTTTLPPLLGTLSPPQLSKFDALRSPTDSPTSNPEGRSFDSRRNQQESKGYKRIKSVPSASHVVSPIHSLLDIFGFNTTNTSTINSRLAPNTDNDYDSDSEQTHPLKTISSHPPRQLPLILEASMSIPLRDYEDDSENSGDFPLKITSTQSTFKAHSKSQSSETSFSQSSSVTKTKNYSSSTVQPNSTSQYFSRY